MTHRYCFLLNFLLLLACNEQQSNEKLSATSTQIIADTFCDSLDSINKKNEMKLVDRMPKVGSRFKVLRKLDFEDGKWILLLSAKDAPVHKMKKYGIDVNGLYYLSDTSILKKIKEEWEVTYLDGDCCTGDFSLTFVQNMKSVFSTGAILSEQNDGIGNGYLQNDTYGGTQFTSPNSIENILPYFKLCKKYDKLNPK